MNPRRLPRALARIPLVARASPCLRHITSPWLRGIQGGAMADDPVLPEAPRRPVPACVSQAVARELRRRGMSETEIDQALRMRKRRKLVEFVVPRPPRDRHDPGRPQSPRLGTTRRRRGRWTSSRATLPGGRSRRSTTPASTDRAAIHPLGAPPRQGRGRTIPSAWDRSPTIAGLAGLPPSNASVTSIIDIPEVEADLARRWSRTVSAALTGRRGDRPPLRAEVIPIQGARR